MKRIIVLVVLSALSTFIWGQHNIFVKGGIGASLIKTDYSFSEHQDKPCPSGLFGVAYNYQFRKNSVFGADLLFNQYEGNEQSVIYLVYQEGSNADEMELNIYRHISDIGLPVYYGYSFKNFEVKIGIQPSVTFSSSGRLKGHYSDESTIKVDVNEKHDKLNIGTFNIGSVAGLGYSITDKLSVEIRYYHGFNNIWKSDELMKSKIRQVTIGVQYNLFRSANYK